ncbi:MAG TPA: hypothetical protein VK666_11170 [Chryseolinea sp.]|nr:hypothetical protein [Chryseolinea sp.]
MSNKLFILTISTLIFASCNYKLLVDKRYVVQREQGYLVFRGDYGVIFFSTKDTLDSRFLSDEGRKEGYEIEFDTDWLDSLSVDYSYIPAFKGVKFSILPVDITYYLGDFWQKKGEQNVIEYNWNNQRRILRFKQHDWRQILMISVVREEDKKRVREKQSGRFPFHY